METKKIIRLGLLSTSVMLPEGATRLIFKKKRTADGEFERCKAHLVAQGFLQTFDVDFFNTYAPVACLTSFRIIHALCVMFRFVIDNMDVDVIFSTQLYMRMCISNLSKDTLHYHPELS